MYNSPSFRRIIEITLVLLPVILFFEYISSHVVNVPYLDDMELIYAINDIKANPEDILGILFRQQNDHRIFFSRLSMLAVYLTTGEINFRYSTLLGLVNLIFLAYAFYLIIRSYREELIYFLPISILLFSPLVYFVHLSSLPAYQHALSVSFSFLSLYFLQGSQKKYWYFSLPLAFASTLTLLDGVSIIPIGLAWLLIQRRFRESAIFGGLSALWLYLYFADFHLSSSSKLVFSFSSVLTMLNGFIVYLGSVARFLSDNYGVTLAYILGIFILLSWIFLIIYQLTFKSTKFRFSNLSLVRLELVDLCFLRILASGVMISIGRSALGIDVMAAIRFQVYSLTIVILMYILLVRFIGPRFQKSLIFFTLLTSISASIYAYIKHTNDVLEQEQGLMADTYNYTHHQLFLHQYFNLPDPPPDFYSDYSFPTFFSDQLVGVWQESTTASSQIEVVSRKLSNVGVFGDYLYNILEIELHNTPMSVPHTEVYLTLQGTHAPEKIYLVSIHDNTNPTVQSIFPSSSRTFYCNIPTKLPPDTYETRICWIDEKLPKSILLPEKMSLD